MRKLLAVVFSAFALFAFSALAAPDAAKVKYGAYAFVPTQAYSMPSAMPPTVATEDAQLTYSVIHTSTGAVSAGAMPSTGAASVDMTVYLFGTVASPPAFNYLL